MQSRVKFVWPHGGKTVFLAGAYNCSNKYFIPAVATCSDYIKAQYLLKEKLVGQFNDWATDQPMHKGDDGTFVAWQLLGPGKYQYKVNQTIDLRY